MRIFKSPPPVARGKQHIGSSINQADGTSIYTRLASSETPDGARARDIGVRIRRRRGRR